MSELENRRRRVLRSGTSAVHAGQPGPAKGVGGRRGPCRRRGAGSGSIPAAAPSRQRLRPGLIRAGQGAKAAAAAGAAEPPAHQWLY